LGDWYVNEEKLGCSLNTLVEDIKKLGMKFGIWVEPEMICPVSDLYHAHPDWCLCQPHRKASLTRNQLILDLSRKDVREYIIERMTAIFSSADISYVKWDMNRNMQEIGSAQLTPDRFGELPHRYMLGLYEILETITQRFPNILFESCASGGGRFDPGMLSYMPQVWTSDDTDAIQRLAIQHGASLVYPPAVMGCHVSEVPNHQVGRMEPIATRFAVAMQGGAFGYEMDLGKLSELEKDAVRAQITEYKKYRHLNSDGDFYRLLSPLGGKECAFMTVSKDKTQAIVSYFKILNDMNTNVPVLKLRGLDENADYRDMQSKLVYSGTVLMKAGLKLPPMTEDFGSIRIILEKM
jgi:alpha-galactosidase